MNNKYLEEVIKDPNLTREQKAAIVKQAYDEYRKQIDTDLNNELLKQYTGAALKIGSWAFPAMGANTLGAQLGGQLLTRYLGRNIAQGIGKGAVSGGLSFGGYELGDALMSGNNPAAAALGGVLKGAATGALGMAGVENAIRNIRGLNLHNVGDIDALNIPDRKQYNKDARNFYQDYVQGISIDKNGKVDFSKRGVQEVLRWNPKQGKNFPDIVNDIKNAPRLPDEPNIKPEQKPNVSHYEVYQGEKGKHYVEVFKNNNKRYYTTKDTPESSDHATSTGTLESPNNIIPNILNYFNPNTKDTPDSSIHATSTGAIESPNNIINHNNQNFNPLNQNTTLYGYVSAFTPE